MKKREQDRAGRGTSTRIGEGAPNQRPEERNWFQKKKDDLIGTKEERSKAKEIKRKARAEQERKEQVSGCAHHRYKAETVWCRKHTRRIRRDERI